MGFREDTIRAARERRAELTAGIEDVLREIREIDSVLEALGVGPDDAPVPASQIAALVATPTPKVEEPQPAEPVEEPQPEEKVEEPPVEEPPVERPRDGSAVIASRVLEAVRELGPASARSLREHLGAVAIGDALFELEQQKKIHRHVRRERGTGQVQYVAGSALDLPEPPKGSPDVPRDPAALAERAVEVMREAGKPLTPTGVITVLGVSKGTYHPAMKEAFALLEREGRIRPAGVIRGHPSYEPVEGVEREPTPEPQPDEAQPEKPKRGSPQHPGAEALPERLRAMPIAGVNIPVSTRVKTGEFQRNVYDALVERGPILANELAARIGNRHDEAFPAFAARVGKTLRLLEEHGLARKTGTGYASWQREQMERTGKSAGRTSIEYKARPIEYAGKPERGDDAPGQPAPGTARTDAVSGATQPFRGTAAAAPVVRAALVRDAVVGREGPFDVASITEELTDAGTKADYEAVGEHLRALEQRGVIRDISPMPDMVLYEYVPPDGPGKAAEIDMHRREAERASNGIASQPVAGTGRLPLPPHAEAKKLVQDLRKVGFNCDPAGSGHWAVTGPGIRRVLISGTPSKGRSVDNDRSRLRRMGVPV